MGNSLFKKVTPHQLYTQNKSSILDPMNKSDVSRANFRFFQKIMITGYNQEQIIWAAQNIRYPKQLFLVKQIDKMILYDNNRIFTGIKELQLWIQAYKQNNMASLFFAQLLFAFHDYQYLYMVYEKIEGFTLDSVLKHHLFTEEETKYVVAVLIQIMQFFHEKKYSLTQLSPSHFIVQKSTGKIKLMQIFNPMQIDLPYTYNNITDPSVYAAPEVLAKNRVLAQSDYYTLGTIMYQMMTQKNVILQELSNLQFVERHHIMAQQVQLKKYNLPEGWNPQAADFLVKLLIKNAPYRLGRYGSFQLRFHPWLQNYNWEILPTRSGITLSQPFFKKVQIKSFDPPPSLDIDPQIRLLGLRDKIFIKFFQNYKYRYISSNRSTLNRRGQNQHFSDRHIKFKQSQKYYDNTSQEQSEISQEQDQQKFDEDSQQIDNYSLQDRITKKRGRPGKGLLNMVGRPQ